VTNFTSYCDKHEPRTWFSRLDALFGHFSSGSQAKHGLEKIKTIGDGYMAAGGLLNEVRIRSGRPFGCGLEMASNI